MSDLWLESPHRPLPPDACLSCRGQRGAVPSWDKGLQPMPAEASLGWGIPVLCLGGGAGRLEGRVSPRSSSRGRHIPAGHSECTDAARAQVPPDYPCQEVTVVKQDERSMLSSLGHTPLCHLIAMGTWVSHLTRASVSSSVTGIVVSPHSSIQGMFPLLPWDHQLHSQTLSYEAGIAVGIKRDPSLILASSLSIQEDMHYTAD